jgi:hypothetical protein
MQPPTISEVSRTTAHPQRRDERAPLAPDEAPPSATSRTEARANASAPPPALGAKAP